MILMSSLQGIRIIRKRILISLIVILCIRFGNFLPLPGVDQTTLNFSIQTSTIAQNLIRTFNQSNNHILFSNNSVLRNGKFSNGRFLINLFTLNIFPYINATILAQLLISYSSSLLKLQKEGSLVGRRKIERGTRFLTAIWASFQSIGISFRLSRINTFYTNKQFFKLNINFCLLIKVSIWLTAGAMIVLWLSDIINDYGLGKGTPLLICINIVSNLPPSGEEIINAFKNLTILSKFSLIILSVFMIIGIVILQLGTTKIAFISSTQLKNKISRIEKEALSFHIPLRLNQIGIMPLIFTLTILNLPILHFNFNNLADFSNHILRASINLIIYFFLLYQCGNFYSNINVNPKDLADQFRKRTSIVPGVKPGYQTAFYFQTILKRLTFLATVFLGILSAFPTIIGLLFNMSNFNVFNSISIIIISGVIIDIYREGIEIYFRYLDF